MLSMYTTTSRINKSTCSSQAQRSGIRCPDKDGHTNLVYSFLMLYLIRTPFARDCN